jgi:hypothetical protein
MREFRGFESPGGDVTVYVREEGQDDSQWRNAGVVPFEIVTGLQPTLGTARHLGLEQPLSDTEASRLFGELAWPRH